jgi:hypothetical protein
MKTAKIARVLVALNIPVGVHNIIAQAKTLYAEIAANPGFFPVPDPTMAVANANLAKLEAAETVALTKAKGAVEARDLALRAVLDDMHHIKAYVQKMADANPTSAEAIIAASTLGVRKARVHSKQDLQAKHGTVSGTVHLVAKAVSPRAAYAWQVSLDQKTWTDVPQTMQAHTSVPNLPVGITHYFRSRSLTKSGTSDWSQIVSIVVT